MDAFEINIEEMGKETRALMLKVNHLKRKLETQEGRGHELDERDGNMLYQLKEKVCRLEEENKELSQLTRVFRE